MVGPSQVAASSSTVLVASVTAVELPPMTPAMLAGVSPAQTTMSSAESSRSVPRRSTTCSPASARRTTTSAIFAAARLDEPIEVEGVERLTELMEHEVGDVDHVVDRSQSDGAEPLAQPSRRRPHDHALDHPGSEARAALRVLDPDLGAQLGRRRRQQLLGDRCRRLVERLAERGRQLARDADVAEAVRPVGGDVEVEDRVEGQHLAERLSRASRRRG